MVNFFSLLSKVHFFSDEEIEGEEEDDDIEEVEGEEEEEGTVCLLVLVAT